MCWEQSHYIFDATCVHTELRMYVMSKSDQTRPQSTNSLLYIQTLDSSPIYFRTPPLDSCYDVTGKLALISLIHVALELHQLICFSAVVSLLEGYHTNVSVYYHTISGTSLKLIVNKWSKCYARASNECSVCTTFCENW